MDSNIIYKLDIVSLIVILRILLSPIFFYLVIKDYTVLAIIIVFVVIFTDYIDGYLIRLIGSRPNFNPYLDPVSDFIFAFFGFSGFVLKGIYPSILLFLLVLMFAQFILTSGKKEPLYDLIGKYYGIFLFFTIGLTLLSDKSNSNLIFVAIVLVSLISLISRIVFLMCKKINKK